MPGQKTSNQKTDSGFSLIELMVVVAIMAILAVIGISGFSNAQKKARDSRRKADVKTIQNAMISSSDTGGNLDALAALTELGGSFPEDPRKGADGENDKYLLFAPMISKDLPTDSQEIKKTIVYLQNASPTAGNTGIVCAALEAADTGNTIDKRDTVNATSPRKTPAVAFKQSDVDQLTGGDHLALGQIISISDEYGTGTITLDNCKNSTDANANCNIFCATF